MSLIRVCINCGGSFRTVPSRVAQGDGRYCSRSCYYGHQAAQFPDRFWAKVDKTAACWVWMGRHSINGYGVMDVHQGRRAVPRGAHIIAWELTHGPIPDSLWVLHNCPDGDRPDCVNPAHLFLGTLRQNTDDMLNKGRQHSKLVADDVRAIRTRYAAGGVTTTELGHEYGVHPSTIAHIVYRETWKHLP